MSLLYPYFASAMTHPEPPNNPSVGSGSPEGVVVGSPPDIYLDSDTDELYFKASGEGTYTGWVLVSGGGGGALDIEALTDAATVTIDASKDGGILTTLSQATNFANPTGTPVDGKRYTLRIESTISRALTWGAKFRGSVDGALPAATSGGGLTDYYLFVRNDTDDTYEFLASRLGF